MEHQAPGVADRFPPLESLGRRIVIMGPTNSGKSTLAKAIGDKADLPVTHIDLLRHLPSTHWQERPDAEFHALYAAAIAEPSWVLDGNYTRLLPERMARATGVIVINDSYYRRTARYLRRTLFQKRVGGLDGVRERITWHMLYWLWTTRHNIDATLRRAEQSGLPMVSCSSMRELTALYNAWDLHRN